MARMKAVVFPRFGGPEVFEVVEMERPEPKADEALVRIHAAGICFHDVLSRAGRIPRDKPGHVLGHEIAGEVAAVGPGVPESRIGERVAIYQRLSCGICKGCLAGRHDLCRNSRVLGEAGGGGYAEYTVVPVRNLVQVPDSVDLKAAAMAACPIGTSVRAIVGVADVKPGAVVLVTGPGGGLGLHQIQIAKALQTRVIAVTTSASKVDAIRAAGADDVVISPDLQFSGDVWRLTGKQGADVILENVVTSTFSQSLRSTAMHAIVVVLGNIEPQAVALEPGLVIGRRIRIAGSGNATYADMNMALEFLRTGAVKPVIAAVLPFTQVARGHALMEARETTGRIILNGW